MNYSIILVVWKCPDGEIYIYIYIYIYIPLFSWSSMLENFILNSILEAMEINWLW